MLILSETRGVGGGVRGRVHRRKGKMGGSVWKEEDLTTAKSKIRGRRWTMTTTRSISPPRALRRRRCPCCRLPRRRPPFGRAVK